MSCKSNPNRNNFSLYFYISLFHPVQLIMKPKFEKLELRITHSRYGIYTFNILQFLKMDLHHMLHRMFVTDLKDCFLHNLKSKIKRKIIDYNHWKWYNVNRMNELRKLTIGALNITESKKQYHEETYHL